MKMPKHRKTANFVVCCIFPLPDISGHFDAMGVCDMAGQFLILEEQHLETNLAPSKRKPIN